MTNREVRQYLLTNIVNAALRAGAAVMKIYSENKTCEVTLKQDKSPITEADCQAHKIIKEYLGATRIPILSEEGREMLYEERCNWELFWLVDPLDGTVEFINRTDEFTINIALMSNNAPATAVIYAPCLNRLYVAAKEYGSFVIEDIAPDLDSDLGYEDIMSRVISLPRATNASAHPVVAISRSHHTPETHAHIEHLRTKNDSLDVIEQGSSYKFCMLAEGIVDYYVRTSGTYEWDTAAGELILSEAGGSTVSMTDGASLLYNKAELDNPWFVCRSASCGVRS